MAETPPVPDGPDTELAAAIAYLQPSMHGPGIENEIRFDREAQRHAATIVRAYLARPAAGRDLTDVEDEILATLNSELKVPPRATARIAQARADQTEGYGSTTSTVEGLLRELDRRAAELLRLRAALARPAVARTDGQPTADPEDSPWAALVRELKAHADQVAAGDLSGLPTTEYQCGLVDGYRGAAGRVRQVLIQQSAPAAPADDTAAPDAAPRPDWSGAWAELTGYVRAATEPIDPARIDAYMVELKREALRPFREWWEQLAAGQPVRDSQDGGA